MLKHQPLVWLASAQPIQHLLPWRWRDQELSFLHPSLCPPSLAPEAGAWEMIRDVSGPPTALLWFCPMQECGMEEG